jgi:hypothetical protein
MDHNTHGGAPGHPHGACGDACAQSTATGPGHAGQAPTGGHDHDGHSHDGHNHDGNEGAGAQGCERAG